MAKPGPKPKRYAIDIGLALLCVHASPGQTMTRNDIAEVCECSTEMIRLIESNALRKLRRSPRLRSYAEEAA